MKHEEYMGSDWPAEGVAMGILIATSAVSFLLVGGGLGFTSWQLLKERNSKDSKGLNSLIHLEDNGVDVIDMDYPFPAGNSRASIPFLYVI